MPDHHLPNTTPLTSLEEELGNLEMLKNQAFYPVQAKNASTKKKKSTPSIINICAWLSLSVCLFFIFISDFSFTRHESMYYPLILLIGGGIIMASLIMHTILHELGHVLGGLAGRRILVTFIVGKWRYEKTVRGYRWRKSKPIAGIAGAAAMVLDTTKNNTNSIRYQLLFMLGGIASNLLIGSIAIYICWYHTVHWNFISIALGLFGITGIGIGLLNLAPFSAKGWNTDGKQVLQLLLHQEDKFTEQLFYLSSLYFSGTHIKDWPEKLLPTIEILETLKLPFDKKINGYNMLFNYALATHNENLMLQCASWVAQHIAKIPDGILQQNAYLMLEFAFIQEDMSLFETWRPYVDGGLLNLEPHLYYLDAEHAFRQKNYDKTRLFLCKAVEHLNETITTLSYNQLKEKIHNLQNRLQTIEQGGTS